MSGHAEGSVRSASHALTHTRLTGRPRHDGNTRKGERVRRDKSTREENRDKSHGQKGTNVFRAPPISGSCNSSASVACFMPRARGNITL